MKSIFQLLVLSSFFSVSSFSQSDSAWKFAETITKSGLKKQLSIIAAADMEGRETGTEGQRKAAAYIESQFHEIGLKSPKSLKDYQQHYPLYIDTLIPKTLKIGKRKYDFGSDYIVTPGSDEGGAFNAKNIIFAGYGIADKNYDDYAGKDVKGKVVLIFSGEPKAGNNFLITGNPDPSIWTLNKNKKAVAAKQHGAVAVLLVNLFTDSLSSNFTTSTYSKKMALSFSGQKNKENAKVPLINISPSIMRTILGDTQTGSLIKAAKEYKALNEFSIQKAIGVKLAYKKKRLLTSATNIIGYIEGTDKKNEYVFLTAHYDHLGKKDGVIYYGADDDGSGTSGVIEMAAAFAKARAAGYGPRRTVVFMTVSGEEEGLWGSAFYADHPVFPLDSVAADLNTDMIGRIDPGRNYGDSMNYVYVIGDDKLSTDLKPLSQTVNNKYTHLELDYKFNAPDDPLKIYYRSDHYNFAKKGVPIIFFFDGIHKDYHKPTDTVDKINFDLMEKRARFIFLTAWDMANRNQMIRRDMALPDELQ